MLSAERFLLVCLRCLHCPRLFQLQHNFLGDSLRRVRGVGIPLVDSFWP
jgi:hypothetical protein